MTLSELRFVVAVAKEKNFRRAASKCFVSQPALSLAIKKLEDELNVSLFERNRTEVTITEIGEKIVAQANLILEEVEKINAFAKSGGDQLDGLIKVGMIHSVGPYLLPQIIPILRKLAPKMPLEVEENITSSLELQLKNGQIDAAIIALPFNIPGIEVLPLYKEEFVVAVPNNHPWVARKNIDPKELSNEKVLLLNSGHCFSLQVVESCPDLSKKGEVLQGNSLETIRNMVASNLGITVLPKSASSGRYQNHLIEFIPFIKPIPLRTIAVAYRKSFVRMKALEIVADAVRLIKTDTIEML
jgi:LysR family hydrogen peroxide-inducible transcriptional activator